MNTKISLREAMKNQGITQKSLEKELGMRRQTIAKRIDDFEKGIRLREEHVEKRFNAIIAQEVLYRNRDSMVSVSEIEDKQIKSLERSVEELKIKVTDKYGFDPETVEEAVKTLNGAMLYHWLCDPEKFKAIEKNEKGSVDVNDLSEMMYNAKLVKTKKDLLKSIEEADSYSVLWDNTEITDKRAIDYEFWDRDHFFGLYGEDRCQVFADIKNINDIDYKEEYIEFEIGVLTNKKIEVFWKKRGTEIEKHRYMASFDNMIPGYKYFFRANYMAKYDDETRQQLVEQFPELKDKEAFTTEVTQFYPLKPAN